MSECDEVFKVLAELVCDIEDTGGLIQFDNGDIVPATDEDWLDLAMVTLKARNLLQRAGHEVKLTIRTPGGDVLSD